MRTTSSVAKTNPDEKRTLLPNHRRPIARGKIYKRWCDHSRVMHYQNKLLITEALVAYGGDARALKPREQRAWELAETMLDSDGLSPDMLISDIDSEWSGP